MRFFSNKTRINNKIPLFKAFQSVKTAFNDIHLVIFIIIAISFAIGGYYVYAQKAESQRYIIETINVFPDTVQFEGWKNVKQVTIQNLSNTSLYQDFNNFNSASIDVESYREQIQEQDERPDVNGENKYISPEEDTINIFRESKEATTTDLYQDESVKEKEMDTAVEGGDSNQPVNDNGTIEKREDILDNTSVDEFNNSQSDSENTDDIISEPLSIFEKASDLFDMTLSSVQEFFPFAQFTATSTSESLEEDVIFENDILVAPIDIVEINETTPTTSDVQLEFTSSDDDNTEEEQSTSTELYELIPDDVVDTNELPVIDVITEISSSTINEEISTTTTNTQPETAENNTGVIDEISICTEDCIPYVVTMSGFGLPIFDQTLRMGGGQLRMSFAAKRKPSRDDQQQILIRYSFDEGVTWKSSGVIAIEDEASNSINGGFYLFSIPELIEPEDLDALMIEIRYEDDPRALEGIYLESAWLELFTVRAPDIIDMDIDELIGDDGYDASLLRGDVLLTEEGEEITFDNTDDNSGETLIIKSNKNTYAGLTKTTTYFSVTNTSRKTDNFSLKTYFPNDVGKVNSVQQWNQNKPKKEIVPDYKPFSYYCKAGWESINQPVTGSLEDVSKYLAPLSETIPEPVFGIPENDINPQASTSQLSEYITSSSDPSITSTTPEVSIPSSTLQIPLDAINEEVDPEISNPQDETITDGVTTTVSSIATALYPYASADEVIIDNSLSQADVSLDELFGLEENSDLFTDNYTCRQTSVVRTCDSIEGDNTSCVAQNVKVNEYEVTRYQGGWEEISISEGEKIEKKSLFKKAKSFLGFGPDIKDVPDVFETRAYSNDTYEIKPGETKYFKMEIEFPPLTIGEFWIEAIGNREYGLLDPYWSSQWQYRVPVTLDNTAGAENLTEQQVFLELTSAGLADFWANVNSDGSDVRFVAETEGNENDTWYDTSWNNRTAITIQSSQVDTSLADFPVYIDLSTLGAEFFNNVQSDGSDIRITLSDGLTELPYELVSINTTTNVGELYFKADSISDLTDTVFYLYYNNAGAVGYSRTDTFGSENVWTNNYLAVYHLEEDQAGIGNIGLYKDATSNNYDGDDENNSNSKVGKLGQGQEFGDTQTDYINLPPEVLDGRTDVTQSWWHRTSQTGQQAIVSGATGPGSTGNNEYLTFFTGSTGFNFYNDTVNTSFTIANHADNTWHAFTNIRNDTANEVRFYVDGVPDNENPNGLSMSTISIGVGGLMVGQEQDTLGGGFASSQNFEGSIDELRFSTGIRSDAWIASEYTNQNTPSTFYATSSTETLSTTQYNELDFWIQYFNVTTNEADIWVQVDSLPAATTTVIYMYYGNTDATTASNELNTFSYSTTTDTYYVLDSVSTGNIEVYSLIDNNIIQLDGGTEITLNAGETTSLSGYSGSSVISVLGPISATIDDAAADTVVPISFATTTFAGPTNRNVSQWFIYSPFASSSVQTYIGGSGIPDESVSIATGTVYTSNTDPGGAQSVIIESSEPILAFHRESGNRDSFVLYPPTTEDIFGIDSNATQVTTLTDNPDPTVYCSGGASATVSGVTRGDEQGVNNCTQGNEGTGDAVRFTGALYPFAAIQQADSDGSESTVFLPQKEFSTEYYMPTASAYAAVVCSPRFGTSTIEVQTNSGTTVESATCAPSGNFPGKAYFNNGQNGDVLAFTAGYKIVSTNGVPFYVIYEDDEEDNDETNIWGAVQARKFLRTPVSVTFGSQEVTIDAQYEQLSFWWFQNVNFQTPTTTWPLGDDSYTSEGLNIVGQGAVNDEDVLRLRLNLQANVATGTASTSAFKLQYTASDTCSISTNNWYDVGEIGSTTVAFTGYDNSLISDGSELSSTTLASSTVFATYEEENFSTRNPNTVNVGDVAEWDWVIQSKSAEVNTNYCFRMTRSAGQELVTYTTYPELYTAGPPLQPDAITYFDNENTASFDSILEFVATDVAGDEINYQVQIDNNLDFSSPVVDRNSLINFLEFENLNTPSDKAPFNSGARIRFTSPTTLTASTTYWWRVRGRDPDGSNTNGEWSIPRSFTTDGSVVESQWYQTTGNQFSTNELVNLSTSTTAVSIVSSPATLTTTVIDFDDATVGNAWGEILWNDTETSGTILYQVEYKNGSSWVLVPDSEIENNSIGNGTSPINILGLDTVIYNQLRVVATLTGTTLSIEDLTVAWGQRVNTPALGDPFDNEQTSDTTPTFTFTTTDPQSDDLEYEISYGTDYLFVASTTINSSSTPANFNNLTTPPDTNPYISGNIISYTVPGGSALLDNTTYWWRVRAKDPNGADSWSPWSDADSLTIDTTTLVSTWFQTTQEQFDQGTFDGLKASTSDSVIVNDIIGEYGKATTTDNTWLEISTQNSYNNMVVVGSARYTGNPQPERTVRVRNKTANTFEIKVDDYTNAFSGGSTIVDYMVMEAGDWTILDGGGGTRIVAGTAKDISDVKARTYPTGGSTAITFTPSFSAPPVVLATVASDNDPSWVFTHTDDGVNRINEPSVSSAGFSLARSFESAVHDPEDIDYIALDVSVGTNNGIKYDFMRSPDAVDGVAAAITYNNTTFTNPPGVNIVNNIGEDGGDGGFAFIETATPGTATQFYPEIGEGGVGANGHTNEIISVVAFESDSGTLLRDNTTVSLSGTVESEPVYFSDGAGPKFEQFLFSQTSLGNSTTSIQIQYFTSTSSWALVPDSQIPGNSTGTTTSPVDLTNVDVSTYDTVRLFGTLSCDGSNCPELHDWTVEWSEGVSVLGTAREYDRSTNVLSGTVAIAVNGTLQSGNTGTISGGVWTINNVTAFEGDVVTVWVDGADEANEAVSVFVYDGVGDMTGVNLFEQHLSISADETSTTTNALLSSYDNSVSGDEDIFFDVTATNDLEVCDAALVGCWNANLYIGAGNVFTPATSTSEAIATHDLINDGVLELDSNTMRVSGSWDNNGTLSVDTSSILFTATSTTELISDVSGTLLFNNLTFGETTGTATWQANEPYDISGNLAVNFGTFDRASSSITVSGGISTGINGFWSGIATTTFDGVGTQFWSDINPTLQNIGTVVIQGSVLTVNTSSDVRAQSLLISAGNTLDAGGSNSLYLSGNFTNDNIFTAQTGAVIIDGSGVSAVVDVGASSLYNFTASTTDSGSISFSQPSVTMLGDFTIATGTITLPTLTTSIGGSFANTGGTFAHNNSEIIFTSSGVNTIEQRGTAFLNAFYDVRFTGSGSWSFIDTNATTTNDFRIQNGNVTLPSGQLTVGGLYETSGTGVFAHNNGEVVLLVEGNDSIITNGSDLNDVRVQVSTVGVSWYDTNWAYRIPIVIDSTLIDSDLSDFPVYINLADLGVEFFSNINSDGGDIRVTQSNGVTEVAREIVSVSTIAETGQVHFNATNLSSTTDTTFYIYYGNNGASDYVTSSMYGAENVWDTNYLAVYHLEEAQAGTGNTGVYRDSTSNGENADDEINSTGKTGLVGLGQQIDGRNSSPNDDHVIIPSTVLSGETNLTTSVWVNTVSTADMALVSAGAGNDFLMWWQGTTFTVFAGGSNTSFTIPSLSDGNWHNITVVRNDTSNEINLFIDGQPDNENPNALTMGALSIPANCIVLGQEQDGCLGFDLNQAYDGFMDEVTFSSGIRSDAWIAATYENQASTTNFYSISAAEEPNVRTFADTNASILGNLVIEGSTAIFPTGILNIGGSFDNNGIFDANGGTVRFDSSAGPETVAAGDSSFATLVFDGFGGNFTIIENATSTSAIQLTDANNFTLNSGVTLEVLGTFSNAVGGASTTWTGSTLKLSSGTDYAINSKTDAGDAYATLLLTGDTDVSMWNSTSTVYTLNDTSSIYSQDHSGTDGNLYIFGDYVRTTGTEYWNYATDFDGVVLSATSSRQVNVRVANGSSVTASSSTLSITGTSTASTIIDAQSGSFALLTQTATVTASYFEMTGTDINGLQLTSSSTVTLLDNALFTIGTGVSAITVDATTVDTNPASQFFNTDFVSGAGNVNVTLSGTPSSYWWFRDGAGDRYGETYDNADGDPGSIRWDDSSYTINISGTVYADDGISPLGGPVCDGVTNTVRVVVNNGSYTDIVPCSGIDGSYTLSNVAYVGDPNLIVYLDTNGGLQGSTITKTPTASITNMDIYVNRVMTRHEDSEPLTIEDMASVYDENDDTDIRFVAATSTVDTLIVRPETELYVFASSTFTPAGTVTLQSGGSGQTYDGTLHIGDAATFTGAGTTTYSIGGSFIMNSSSSFVPASSTVSMTATTSGKAITASSTISFNQLEFTGVGGGWNINTDIDAYIDVYVATGTVTGTGNITVQTGSMYGNGTVSLGGGTVTIETSNTLGGNTSWLFNNLTVGSGVVVGTTTLASNATTTVGGVLTVSTAHFLNAGGSIWNLTGSGNIFIEDGTFIEATSTVQYGGTTNANVLNTAYYNLSINTPSGSPTITAGIIGLQVLNDLFIGGSGDTILSLNTNDPSATISGDVYISSNGTLIGSDISTLTVSGNWDNDGSFISSGGLINFDSTDAFTLAAGVSSFGDVLISASGVATVSENATSTGYWQLATTSYFTVASGTRLAVGGMFTNNIGGASTTWTGSTLHLYGTGWYEINSSTTTDTYGTLSAGAGTHIRVWNSDAVSYLTATGGSIYSMDHATIDGELYIFGDYVQDSLTDYWSYATDFDGTNLTGGSERQVQVFFESGATAIYTGGGLTLLGTTTATTTLQNQGAGVFGLTFSGTSVVDWNYAIIRDIDSSGVVFTGTPTVQDFSYTDMLVEINSGTTITVGGTAIDASPARNFTNNSFAAAGGVTGAVNVTATGTTVSSWRYTNTIGALAGEAFDSDPAGDPGYIVWDDSAALITISGNVYNDEGSTVSTVCDGVTANVMLRVAGLTTASTTCNASTGAYSISNVTFSANDTLTLYISGETAKAANVSIDPISSISDMDLYENRVIVRHEGTDPITIEDMSVWDSSDDADIPFTAINTATDTLSLPSNTKLIIWNNKEFAPNGEVTLTGAGAGATYDGTLELYSGATFTAAGTENHNIGGSLLLGSGATFVPANSTTTFTTTGASRTIDINSQALYNVAFTGSGSWSIIDPVFESGGNVLISSGTLTLPTGTTTLAGSFENTGGAFVANNGIVYFKATSPGQTVTLGGSDLNNVIFDGSGGTWTMSDSMATTTGSFNVAGGSVTLPSGILAVGGDFINTDSISHNNGTVKLTQTSGAVALTLSGDDLFSLILAGGATTTMTDTSAAFLGDLTVASGTIAVSTSTLSIGGSLDATSGVMNTASGTILFNSADTGELVNAGNNNFYNVTFGSAGGGWTLQSATSTNNFTLSSASNFTLASGQTLVVNGVFTNLVGGTATTWTGSTLNLAYADTYEVNTKTSGGDIYNQVIITADADVSIWNSSFGSLDIATSSSYYSQDNAGVDGDLYIYGDYHVSTSTEYWSYATDFDGSALGGSSRAVNVYFDTNATTTLDGGSLEIVGIEGSTTTVQSIFSSDAYAFEITSGVLNASYYSLQNTNLNGLFITGTPTIIDLSNGSFLLTENTGSSITITAEALNANASKLFANVGFSASSTISGSNVEVTVGTTSSSWRFLGEYGDIAGEVFDIDGLDACGSVRWDDSSCLLVEQTNYRWRNDDGGLGVPDSQWLDTNWSKRKRVRVTNEDATSYSSTSVKMTVTYDADMQADFEDLRFTKNDGVTEIPYWTERYTPSTNATVWLLIDSLPASESVDVHMYYGNVTATSSASSSEVFVASDDFEDGNISEYTGDTSLFTIDGSFAYGGSSGLDTTGFESSRATDGIGRTDQTVSQGEIIRYMQYVDTSAGSSDEPCTLFGIQSVTANTNYGVCLEQFGTDRLTLAENVESTDTYGGVIVLATTTVTYVTGWYEVEIDWQTDNTIDVSLYDSSGSLVATTSATDSTYTSGGYGFTYWGQNGGWDSFTSRYRTDTEPSVLFGSEQVRSGATWNAPLNTISNGFETGDIARIRFAIENTGLSITNQSFQLEFADKASAPSCEAVSPLSYTAVPVVADCGVSGLCMATTSQYTNQTIIADLLEQTSGIYVDGYAVEDPSATTTAMDIDQNEYTELEYAITATINAASDAYCLRVTNEGTDLDSYAAVAEYALAYEPILGSVSFNEGNDIALIAGTTTRVYATTTVTDLNGYADLSSASSTMFTASSTAACAENNNDCYIETTASDCSFTGCSGNSCVLSCYADVYYHADATDTDGGNFWYAFLEVSDDSGGTDFATSPGIDVLTLRALDVTNSINYGALAPSTDTGVNNASTTIENLGNDAIDVQIVGNDLSDGYSSTIPASEQIFATSTFDYSSCVTCTTLATTSINYEVDLSKPTTTAPPVTDDIFWGIAIPFGVASNPHTGLNTFYAIGD